MKTYKMHFVHLFSLLLLGVGRVEAAEYHVSLKGDPAGDGSYAKPLNILVFTADNMNFDSSGICCGSIKENNI